MTVCSNCSSLNNVDTNKALEKSATCGKCGSDLKMHSLVSEVNGQDLQRILDNAKKPVIVDFWASWCGPCKMYGPEFEKASILNKQAIFLKVNTEENQRLSQELGIRGIPATIVFKNGKEYRRQAGALEASMIGKLIK